LPPFSTQNVTFVVLIRKNVNNNLNPVGMKILVCISKSPDTTSKIAFTDGNTKFDENGVQYIVNPYDEWYALVRALELKEAQGGHVTIITVGSAADEAVMRKALAIGADDAVRINAEAKDAYFVASQIADYAKANGYNLVLTGKETIDFNGSQVGGMIAELMDAPFVSLATKLDVSGNTASLDKEIVGGIEEVEVSLPAVISCAKGMAEQRIPNMRGIMAARTKPLQVVEPNGTSEFTSFVAYELPPAKSACKMIDPANMDELVELLHNEAKVI
jgi:electron transfer flavoprotein beta subunit